MSKEQVSELSVNIEKLSIGTQLKVVFSKTLNLRLPKVPLSFGANVVGVLKIFENKIRSCIKSVEIGVY